MLKCMCLRFQYYEEYKKKKIANSNENKNGK